MMWWNHDSAGAGNWITMSLMMLVFVGALIACGVWLLRSTHTGADHSHTARAQSADDILAERLARGEIDEDGYARRRELLRNLGTTITTK
jgi:putative membrane protein